MFDKLVRGVGFGLVFCLGALAQDAMAAETPAVQLDPGTLPAQGKHHATLTVAAFGRYAIAASSAQGVALRALDRIAGAGPAAGEPGARDGRLDLFLERGETRILSQGVDNATGEVKLAAHAFRELNPRPPLLLEQRLETASLNDFEQVSYWLDIKAEGAVALEAGGRHLADLRLWRDGTWLVDAQPEIERNDARPAQPLTVARLTARLAPGLYLLTAYGGPGLPWTEAGTARPLHLRWGMASLGEAGRQRLIMNELGVERFKVPPGPTYFRLELPSAREASLQVGDYTPEAPLGNDGGRADIGKKSMPPVAELYWHGRGAGIVTIRAEPGQPYVLQHFQRGHEFQIDQPGQYWLSSIHAGHGEDSVGASAVLTRRTYRGKEAYVADRAIELDARRPWHRRFNLLEPLSVFVKLTKGGTVGVLGQGVPARYRFEPFLTARPANYQSPPWHDSGHVFALDAGLHVLTVLPVNKGIHDLHLVPAGARASAAITPVVSAARFGPLTVEPNTGYSLYLNEQPGVAAGIVLRPLPIDLGQALPVSQRPGERLAIPVTVPEAGTLRALSEDGQALEISLADGRKGRALAVAPGRHEVIVTAAERAIDYALSLEPTRLARQTPLPDLPDARRAGLPDFPVIGPDAPQYLRLDRQADATFAVRVERPGIYRFESSGLLQTAGKVRTRINPSLFEASANGVGRNFLIQRYLREGDYQLGVRTEGETRGDLGVHLARADPVDGGELRPGESASALLTRGNALAYRLRVGKQANYRIETLGLGRNFALRLEDEQGWPLDLSGAQIAPQRSDIPAEAPAEGEGEGEDEGEYAEPMAAAAEMPATPAAPRPSEMAGDAGVVDSGDITLELAPGHYRLLVLPLDVDARVLTRFEPVPKARHYTGHGPHRLRLGAPVRHTWLEPAIGQARVSDHWRFALPAPAEVDIRLDAGMEARLYDEAERRRPLFQIAAGKPWRGTLAAGRYLLRARHGRGDSQVDYQLDVTSKQLLAGQTRELTAPARLPVSVGGDGLVVLRSFGVTDLRAKLYDAAGKLVAQNDDQAEDWNFRIAQRLTPGQYTLAVEAAGEGLAPAQVVMQMPDAVAEPAQAPGDEVEIKDSRVHVYPLTLPGDANVLLVDGLSGTAAGLALEGEGGHGWVNLGSDVGKTPYLLLPLAAERYRAYRLRAWSTEARGLPLRWRAVAANLPAVDEARWLRGDAPAVALDPQRPDLRVAAVKLDRPGSFKLWSDGGAWQWSDSPNRAADFGGLDAVALTGPLLWLLGETAAPPAGARLRLPTGDDTPLRLQLAADRSGQIDPPTGAAAPALVIARAWGGQPGLALGEGREAATMGLAPGQAVAVALTDATAPVTVWRSDAAETPIDIDLRQVDLVASPARRLAHGLHEGELKPGEAQPLDLPAGAKHLDLVLAADTAAVLVKSGGVQATHWAGGAALREAIVSDAERIWLINAGAEATRYGLELAARDGVPAPLRPGGLIERNLTGDGRLRIPVELPVGATGLGLHARGEVEAIWQEDGGRSATGLDFTANASGSLWLRHRSGPLVVWLDAGAGAEPPDAGLSPTVVAPPQTLALQGKTQLLAFQFEQPAMLHLRSATPMVSQYLLPGQAPRVDAHLNGAHLDLVAPGKGARLLLRPLGAETLSGGASVHATAAIPLGEGVGPELLLPPGGARLFSFELKQAASVGIGVRASADVARSVLYDQDGAQLGEGVVQMAELKPGRYLLAVDIPADGPPARVTPLLFGVAAPDTRPPYDILRRYVEADENSFGLIHDPGAGVEPEPTAAADEVNEADAASPAEEQP